MISNSSINFHASTKDAHKIQSNIYNLLSFLYTVGEEHDDNLAIELAC